MLWLDIVMGWSREHVLVKRYRQSLSKSITSILSLLVVNVVVYTWRTDVQTWRWPN